MYLSFLPVALHIHFHSKTSTHTSSAWQVNNIFNHMVNQTCCQIKSNQILVVFIRTNPSQLSTMDKP